MKQKNGLSPRLTWRNELLIYLKIPESLESLLIVKFYKEQGINKSHEVDCICFLFLGNRLSLFI